MSASSESEREKAYRHTPYGPDDMRNDAPPDSTDSIADMPTLLDAARRVVESTYPDDPDPDLPPAQDPRTFPSRSALDDLEAALDAYEWSDEPPTEPGWYWYKEEGCEKAPTKIRESSSMYHPGRMVADLTYNLCHYRWVDDAPGKWAGPIPEPTDTDQ